MSLLPDIVDGKALSPYTEGVLQGRLEFKRAPLPDPDIPRHALSASEEVERAQAEDDRAGLQLEVRRMLRKLPPTERAVIRLRFGIGGPSLGVIETAERLGYSRTSIWAIERRALANLAGSSQVIDAGVSVGRAA